MTVAMCVAMALAGRISVAANQATPAASADEGVLEEVVITAEKRSEDVQKTALSVTVISAEQVEKTGVTTLDNLLEQTPAIQVEAAQGPAAVTPYIAIRGVGTDGDNKPGATQMYLDGILTGNLGAELYDLQRVEVLRGPQGTLYGGSATGGAVNMISNNPDFAGYSGSAQGEIGNFGLLHEIGVLNAPITDTVAVRFAVNSTKRDSYADKLEPFANQTNARMKLLVKPSESMSLLFGAEFWNLSGPTSDGFGKVNADGKPIQSTYQPEYAFGQYEGYRGYANLNFNLGFAKLTNITSVEKTHDNPQDLSNANGAQYTDQPHKDTTTEELRLSNGDDSPITWVVGLWDKYYYQRDQVNIEFGADSLPLNQAGIGIIVPETNRWKQYAGFGQVTVPLGETTRITGGLRYSNDHVNYDQDFTWEAIAATFGPPGSGGLNCGTPTAPVADPCTVTSLYDQTTKRWDYLARVEHDFTSNNMVYALNSTGYRPGGLSAPSTAYTQPVATYAPEVVHAYELGSKNRFLNNKLQVNADVYYNRYPAFQNEITNISGQAHIPSIVGIPATFYGAELELVTALNQANRLSVSASYIHAQYTADGSWSNPFNPTAGPLGLATNGGMVPHAPKFQGNVDYTNTATLGNGGTVVTDLQAHYQTSQATTFDPCLYSAAACVADGSQYNGLVQSAYTLFNSSVSYNSPGSKFAATLYCRNCFNQAYTTYSAGNGYYGFGAPRTFGLVLSEKF